jgi:hypothetical protein
MNDDEIMIELEGDLELAAIWRNLSREGRANLIKVHELSERMGEAEFNLLLATLGRALRELRTGKAHDDA